MASLTTTRRQIQQCAVRRVFEQNTQQAIAASEHYTEADRVVFDAQEGADLFAAFVAEELK
jgi:hypothetical protein